MPRKKNRRKELQAAKRKETAKTQSLRKIGILNGSRMTPLSLLVSLIINNPNNGH